MAPLQAQKKSELLETITNLKSEIMALKDSVSLAKRQANASQSKTELMESQNQELRDANMTLLQNLNNFSKISKQNSENINKTISSLNAKEAQLKGLNEAFSKNDSTAIVLLTKTKQQLGDDTQVGTSKGAIVISKTLDFMFEDQASGKLAEAANTWLGQMAQVITSNPDRKIEITGLSMTGEFDIAYLQATAVANALIKNHGITSERLTVMAKDGNFSEGINFRLAPDYVKFYDDVKESIKN
ncbi:MAG: hypothetical protein HKO09_06810 [Croceitalea sp.]|nr:hypothetical protein [Croceitalea sp.]